LKLKARDLAIALVLIVGIIGAVMASNSPSNLALGATTCGINGCVSTPPLSSSTSYQYTNTSPTTITATSSTFSTSISSSTTTTTATTTSTFFSYTSTISTTISTTSYTTSYTSTMTSAPTNVLTFSTTTTSSSTYTNFITQKGVSTLACPVTYVTNGNRLQPYADFLRSFRDNRIQNTTAGRVFMQTFNSWYYSWAPSVTYSAATSPWVFRAVQVSVVPLLGILYASYYSYALVAPMNAEAGAIVAGIVTASLIGLVYVAPILYATTRIVRRHSRLSISRRTLGPSAIWFVGSVLLCVAAYATSSGNLLAVATSSLVLSMLSVGSLTGARALMYIQLPFVNPANMALLLKRFTRTLTTSTHLPTRR